MRGDVDDPRIQVLNGVVEGKVTVAKAAGLMGVSERHAWRLLAAYREEGPSAVAHGNRGRKPATTTLTQQKVMELAEGPYAGLNHTHLTEVLVEREDVQLSRSTVRRVLLAEGVRSPRRAPRRYIRRERYPQEGMVDRWQPPRLAPGPGTLSDPRGCRGRRHRYGPLRPVQTAGRCARLHAMLKDIIDQHGVPLALYSDRHGIFQRSPKEPETIAEQLRGRRDPTQFGRALEELEIRLILAHTPQAKGRIERVWGTFQDRLVAELRLAGATTIEQANDALELHPTLQPAIRCRPSQAGLSLSSTPYWRLPP